MYVVREAKEEDRVSVVELLFRNLKSLDSFEESWVSSWENYWNKPENEDWAFVATYNDEVVANLAFFANEFNQIRGNPVRFGGVWAVATDEKHRRKGLMRNIYENAFRSMREKGIVLSILEPSSYDGAQAAYEHCGYALAETRMKHSFPPHILRVIQGEENITVRELDNPDAHQTISEIEQSMSRFGSRVFTWPAIFIGAIKSGDFHMFEEEGEPVGCAKVIITESDKGTVLQVSTVRFKHHNVLPSIFGLIAEKSTDVSEVEWQCDVNIPVHQYVTNIHRLKTESVGAMMMRVVDFTAYCKSIGVPESANKELILTLTDSFCEWNEGTFRLAPESGTLQVERIGDEKKSEIILTPHQLSLVISGLTFPSELQELGLISCPPETASKLDDLFPMDEFVSYFRF